MDECRGPSVARPGSSTCVRASTGRPRSSPGGEWSEEGESSGAVASVPSLEAGTWREASGPWSDCTGSETFRGDSTAVLDMSSSAIGPSCGELCLEEGRESTKTSGGTLVPDGIPSRDVSSSSRDTFVVSIRCSICSRSVGNISSSQSSIIRVSSSGLVLVSSGSWR